MLVNIWATLVHVGDAFFCGADLRRTPSIDLLICDGLRRATRDKQTWMISPIWMTQGTTGRLLTESYTAIRDSSESYLLLITPGFSDLLSEVPIDLMRSQLAELCRRARMFNKRCITATLGTPPACPPLLIPLLREWNAAVKDVTECHDGVVADLTGIRYSDWTANASRPVDLGAAAAILVSAVLSSHSAAAEWKAKYAG